MICKLDFCTDAYPPTGGYARPFYWFEYANVLDNWAMACGYRMRRFTIHLRYVFKICRRIARFYILPRYDAQADQTGPFLALLTWILPNGTGTALLLLGEVIQPNTDITFWSEI